MSLSRVLTSAGFILLISTQFATAFYINNLSKKEVPSCKPTLTSICDGKRYNNNIKEVPSSCSTSPSIYDGKRYNNNNIILLQYSNDANHDNESIPPAIQQQQPLSTNNEHLSASQRERREEDKRRKLREGENRPGSTSAIPGAQDYPINVDKTEKEYLQSLSTSDDDSVIDEYNIDKFVALWTDQGLAHLKMLHFQEASESFKKVYEIKPEAYLWQDGLLKYYLEDYHDAAESLAKNAVRYETRFMEPASEERIWRDAAELKIIHTINGGRKMKNKDSAAAVRVAALLEDKENDVNEEQSEKDSIASERRKVFRLARQLFSSSLQGNSAGMTLARAQLQAMCGDSFPPLLKSTLPTMPTIASEEQQQSRTSLFKVRPDHKMYKLHSLFYLGLHYDALGQTYESKQCMKMALKTCADSISGNNQDITYLLPVIHMTIRDWYDDDEWEDDDDNKEKMELDLNSDDILTELVDDGGVELELKEESEADIEQRLRNSIKDMRVVDLKAELKRRSLKVGGTKKVLQDRLIDDLRKSDL